MTARCARRSSDLGATAWPPGQARLAAADRVFERSCGQLAKAQGAFEEAAVLMGESDAKEPGDLFDVLEKFIRRFEMVTKEVDDEKRMAEEQKRAAATKGLSKKVLRSGRAGLGGSPATAQKKIAIRSKATAPSADAAAAPNAPMTEEEALPKRRLSSASSSSSMASRINNAATGLFRGGPAAGKGAPK